MSHEIWFWVGFNVFVITMLILDLGVFHRKAHVVEVKEAMVWASVWISLALLFNVGVYIILGPVTALEFLTGYLIEESLSVDNLFVFLMIFSYFQVPRRYQHKVLFWGILGAIIMRAFFIAVGVTLIRKFHWIIYVFGAILIVTGVRMGVQKDKELHPEKNPVLKIFRRFMPVTKDYVEDRFFVREGSRTLATPLFIVLLMVETTDLIFAVDSIPAVLAITRDPFIVYTSNVFAIMGLRSIFFALAGIMQLFVYLQYGLALILTFVGVKMVLSNVYHIPVVVALAVVATILAASVIASIIWAPKKEKPGAFVSDAFTKKDSSDSL